MNKKQLRRPFLVVNPKSYLYGEKILDLALYTDKLSKKYDIDVLFTAQHVDIAKISDNTEKLVITAQHMDGHTPGPGMGHILPEGLKAAGVQGTFLNHAEHPMSLHELAQAMKRADELGILTIVCADSVAEAKAIAKLNPDIMICEPTELIGTGQASDTDYMKATNEAVKSISPNTQVLQAAGISTGEDVYNAIITGADGTGGTSGIVCVEDPKAKLDEMFEAISKAREDIKEE